MGRGTDRDRNDSWNILKIAKRAINKKERLSYFTGEVIEPLYRVVIIKLCMGMRRPNFENCVRVCSQNVFKSAHILFHFIDVTTAFE